MAKGLSLLMYVLFVVWTSPDGQHSQSARGEGTQRRSSTWQPSRFGRPECSHAQPTSALRMTISRKSPSNMFGVNVGLPSNSRPILRRPSDGLQQSRKHALSECYSRMSRQLGINSQERTEWRRSCRCPMNLSNHLQVFGFHEGIGLPFLSYALDRMRE